MAQITIAAVTITNWQGGTSGIVLRIYVNSDFTSADGNPHPKTLLIPTRYGWIPNPAGSVYEQYACTMNSGSLAMPEVTLDSTTDSTDNPAATYTAVIWDTTANLPVQTFGTKNAFSLDPSPTSVTWQQVWTAQAGGTTTTGGGTTTTYPAAMPLTDVATGTHYQLQIVNGVLEQVVVP